MVTEDGTEGTNQWTHTPKLTHPFPFGLCFVFFAPVCRSSLEARHEGGRVYGEKESPRHWLHPSAAVGNTNWTANRERCRRRLPQRPDPAGNQTSKMRQILAASDGLRFR